MKFIAKRQLHLIPVLFFLIFSAGCGHLISPFSETAYLQATSLKVETLALMDRAEESYSEHENAVQALMMKIEAAYEYAKHRPKNEFSTKQWEILKDPNRNLVGGFFEKWKKTGTISRTYIDEAKQGLIIPAFDEIIKLESGKIKPKDAQVKGE